MGYDLSLASLHVFVKLRANRSCRCPMCREAKDKSQSLNVVNLRTHPCGIPKYKSCRDKANCYLSLALRERQLQFGLKV